MFLELEPKAQDQVPLLLSMGQQEAALSKALQSADTDLCYLVLLALLQSVRNEQDLHRLAGKFPEAAKLLALYYRHEGGQGQQKLHALYLSQGA